MRQLIALFLPVLLAATACSAERKEGASQAEVRLPALAGRPGVAYFRLTGGARDTQLMQVTSPDITRIELHETVTEGSLSKMRPLDGGVTIAAKGEVLFATGGKHAMLFDVNPRVKAGEKITLTFHYADGRKLEAQADVKAPGDAAGERHH